MWVARGTLILEVFLSTFSTTFLLLMPGDLGGHPLEIAQQRLDMRASRVKRGADLRLLACAS
eukprot:scaffold80240_cov28-Tisochrysis_lutea.AAC.3